MYATWEFILLHFNKPTHTYARTHTYTQCLTVEQLQLISQLALSSSKDPDVRANVMTILGTAGRMALKNQPPGLRMLSVRFMYME